MICTRSTGHDDRQQPPRTNWCRALVRNGNGRMEDPPCCNNKGPTTIRTRRIIRNALKLDSELGYICFYQPKHTFFRKKEICLDSFIIGDSKIERMGAQEQEELRQQVTRSRIKYNFCKAIKAKNAEAGARTKKFGRHHHHQSTAAQESIAGAVMQVMAEDFKREKED